MITYEQAFELAIKAMPNIDACTEYENAYMFKRKADKHSIGGNGTCVILKSTGKVISQAAYYDSHKAAKVKEFDLFIEDCGGIKPIELVDSSIIDK